jgi:4-amino-4-deoxychorismate lyase
MPVGSVELEELYPKTLALPAKYEEKPEKAVEFSPLTGGALTMGPTDYQPVPNRKLYTPEPKYKFFIDRDVTLQNAHTSFKTTWRPHYDACRPRTVAKQNDGPQVEILLRNPKGEITEGSLTTVYFLRDGSWVTPPVHEEYSGQRGTTRRWALDSGICAREEAVKAESVRNNEYVWVSNGVRGFGWGVVVLG